MYLSTKKCFPRNGAPLQSILCSQVQPKPRADALHSLSLSLLLPTALPAPATSEPSQLTCHKLIHHSSVQTGSWPQHQSAGALEHPSLRLLP